VRSLSAFAKEFMKELRWRLTEVDEAGVATFTLNIECQAYDEITKDMAESGAPGVGSKFNVIWVTLGMFAALAPVLIEYN
jgi:hypothetical protein